MKYQLEFCIGSRLRRLSRIADANIRKFLKDFKITENQMTILFAMHELGRVEQGKIGEVLCLERSTVSRNVKLLEKQGLISRTTFPSSGFADINVKQVGFGRFMMNSE